MPVIGITIQSFEAERKGEVVPGMKIDNQTSLKDVSVTDLPAINKKGLSVKFDFKTTYKSDRKTIGEITIKGNVFLLEKNVDSIAEGWKKNKKLPEEMNLQIINTILRKCLTEALVLSEKLQLPPPIAFPFASKRKPEQSRYIG